MELVCKGRNLDREKYGVKGNGEKPSQVWDSFSGTGSGPEKTWMEG